MRDSLELQPFQRRGPGRHLERAREMAARQAALGRKRVESDLSVQMGKKHLFGAPLLPVGLARLVCAREAALDGGDHTILVGRVTRAEVPELDDLGDPLLHYNRGYRALADLAE